MKFTLALSSPVVTQDEAERLTTIGFDFNKIEGEVMYEVTCMFSDEDLPVITINTLEELTAFQEKAGHSLIMRDDNCIEVYNGYRE